jgi:hypothetical protein
MNEQPYQLFNTATEEVEARQNMTERDAEARNIELRRQKEPRRWVKVFPEDEEEV